MVSNDSLINLKRLKIQSSPNINIAKARVNTEWICEYPPTVSAVSQTTLAFSAKTTKGTGFGGVGGSGGAAIDEQVIDLLIAKKIKNKVLITNRIETFEIVTTKSTGFTTSPDEDVIFNGKSESNGADSLFWNGTSSTLYVNGNLVVREACLELFGARVLTSSDAVRTVGIKFNYYNADTDQAELGWFGYDPSTKCFKYLLDVTIDTTTDDYECYPCQVISGTPGDICTDTFVGQNLRNKSMEEQDLNILSDQSVNIEATNNINLDSSSYTSETTTGMIMSNTGTEGIDILSSNGAIDIISTSAEMNINTNDNNMFVHVDTGNMEICVEDGDLDICVSGSDVGQDLNLTAEGESCINMQSQCDTANAITIEATEGGIDIIGNGTAGEDIDITNTASVNITGEEAVDDAVCLLAPNGGICLESGTNTTIDTGNDLVTTVGNNYDVNVTGDTTFDSNNITITVTDDLVINGAEKTDFRTWIPYKTFDVQCGFWQSIRDTTLDTAGCPIYYWRKVAKAETAYITVDIVNPFRIAAEKGFQLNQIYFSYIVETEAITSITPKLIKKTYNEVSPSTAVDISEITYTDGNLLTSGLSIGDHYRYITIDNPDFVNDESVITIELELVTPASSVFKFFGIMLHHTEAFY